MFVDERRNEILRVLEVQKKVSVNELVESTHVSAATIRADLNDMEKQGLLVRTHGGAMYRDIVEDVGDKRYQSRQKKFQTEKHKIAEVALQFIESGQCIMLDASSTCFELAKLLKGVKIKLTIVTSGLSTAQLLKENPYLTVIVIGGIVRADSNSIEGLIGQDILSKLNIDLLFTSAHAFNLRDGLTDFNLYEVELKRQMVLSSHEVVALLDHSKIQRSSAATFASVNEIDFLITNQALSEEIQEDLAESNIVLKITN